MSEWTVVTALVTIVGLIAAVVSPIVKLNTAITRINAAVESMERDMETLKQNNAQGHDRLWESEKVQEEQLANLKIRLAVLEKIR